MMGAIPVLAFPSANLEWLAWAGLVPGFALMRNAATRREAGIRGWWFGAGYLLAAMYWLAPNLGPGLLLVAIVIGALWSMVGIAVWSLLRPPVRARGAVAALVVVPSSWLVTEWIRSWQALGGPWAVLGASQWQHPAVLALAAVGGVWLVSFAVVLANTALLLVIVARTAALRLTGLAAAGLAIAAGPVAFALTAPMPVSGPLTIALVQPGIVAGRPSEQPGMSSSPPRRRAAPDCSSGARAAWVMTWPRIERCWPRSASCRERLALTSWSVRTR